MISNVFQEVRDLFCLVHCHNKTSIKIVSILDLCDLGVFY